MEMDQGKIFIGGISWDTDEDRLKEYFGHYGEVIDAVIMRDRNTGRARGFGFVVFSDPSVAEKVVKGKHIIDGRTVEAKKAVPRDDQNLLSRSSPSTHSSPGQVRTKKIFVGGLPSTVTETDFKAYFDQFGTITDVVVMYDHNTQRPRGFGFITFDSEDAVERVLHKTFHELDGKMVEVKRAVPKELSPGPNRSPLMAYNYGLARTNNYTPQGYNLGSMGGYGLRMSPLNSARGGFSQFGSTPYGMMGLNMDRGLNAGFGAGSNFSGNLGNGRVLEPYFGNNQTRYSTGGNRGDSFFISSPRDMWGNGGLNSSLSNAGSGSYFGSGNGGRLGAFGNNAGNWGGSAISASLGGGNGNNGSYNGGNVGYRTGENNYALRMGGFGRNRAESVNTVSSFSSSSGGYEGSYNGDSYRVGSVYGDNTWQTPSSQFENSASFGYGLGRAGDLSAKESEENGTNGYGIANRHTNRGIAS